MPHTHYKRIANSRGVEHLEIKAERPEVARELKAGVEGVFNPFESSKQRRAMYAAASGHSRLGIPRKVARKFIREEKHGK